MQGIRSRKTGAARRLRPLAQIVGAGLLLALAAAPAAAQVRGNDVEVEMAQFGIGGGVFRPGGVTPIRVNLTSDPAGNLDEVAMVWVQWEVPNADGDVVEYGRPVTLTRGRPAPVWLYAPLPPDADSQTTWAVRVFEISRDGRRRSEVGGRRIRAADVNARSEPITSGRIAVIGQRQMRLDDYSVSLAQPDRPLAAHEITRVLFGIRPEQLPDRWRGLTAFEAIAWSDALPQDLTTDGAAALREYVRRGGHLIISLPEDANPWRFGVAGQTALEDMLPRTEPRKDEAVHISELVSVLSKARGTTADFTMGVRYFRDARTGFDAIDNHYEPVIALPDGRVVVVQRTFGHGRVTVIGIDLSAQRLYSIALSNGTLGIPQGDVFWNRILGRRQDTPRIAELERMREADVIARPSGSERNIGSGALFAQQIAMSTQAGVGLLLAVVLFAAYWLLAGPGGFAVLKFYKRTHHAWLAFAGAAGVFTAVAWGTVGLIRIKHPQVQHVTVLDHIARADGVTRPEDPQMQRAVSWFSLYLPGYGRTPVAIESGAEGGSDNLLLPWTPPGESVLPFPNVDRYAVDVAEQPAAYAIPARQTATQFAANWLGGLDPDWGGMIRPHPDDPIRVVRDGAGLEVSLGGSLVHDLPGALRNVKIIWVRNNRVRDRMYARSGDEEFAWPPRPMSGQMLNTGYFWARAQWGAEEAVNLAEQDFSARALLERGIEEGYLADLRRQLTPALTPTLDARQQRRRMEMLSLFHQLTPPEYYKARPDDPDPPSNVYLSRQTGREMDLSAWLGRPCLIVIGYLENSALPIPLRVGDSDLPPDSRGLTMVRWIYPLPVDERIAFRSFDEADGDV